MIASWTLRSSPWLLAFLLITTVPATGPAIAGSNPSDVDLAASADAGGTVTCASSGATVTCDASAVWRGSVDCTGLCRAEFGDETGAYFHIDGQNPNRTAAGNDSCRYSLNGCDISDTHDFQEIVSSDDGCYTATLYVKTVTVAEKVDVPPQQYTETHSFKNSDQACV